MSLVKKENIAAPLPTHFSPSIHYMGNSPNSSNHSMNIDMSMELSPTFTVPDNFQIQEKPTSTPKSNSWFNTGYFRSNNDKGIRRVASAPNTNQLQRNLSSVHSIQPIGEHSNHQLERLKLCRRTYSSNSIKVKHVEVGPSSFVKIRMLGKGDVGKVYMVRQKGTDKLYAMKGKRNNKQLKRYHA